MRDQAYSVVSNTMPIITLSTVSIRDKYYASLLSDLDLGEAEAIALAIEHSADLLLIDER